MTKQDDLVINNPALAALSEPKKWFPQKPILVPLVAALVLYSMIGHGRPELLVWVDKIVTPLVDSLKFIGLGISKPLMDGPMPERFYTNLVGFGVWAVVVYNVAAIRWFLANRQYIGYDKLREQRLMAKKGWSQRRAWYVLRATILFVMLPVAVYFTLSFLNGIHGWFVFHVKDFVVPTLIVMTWVFPGAFIISIWAMVLMFVLHDVRDLSNRLRLLRRPISSPTRAE